MDSFDIRSAAESFFSDFDEAFATFNGAIIAERYTVPYLAVQADGSATCYPTTEAIAAYFQQVVSKYESQGCRSCRHKDLDVIPLGTRAAFASVTWELLREDGSVVNSWRESYNLLRAERGFKACASMDQAR